MADLRARFIEDYAGGLLNVARQELSSTGEVLAQDGFVEGISLFVEDGRGVKSGLRLGSALAECIDPATETGILNVRSADRTYAKIRDLKAFATAVASAQGALTESVAESLTNLEGAFESLEADVQSYRTQLNELIDSTDLGVSGLSSRIDVVDRQIVDVNSDISTLSAKITTLENTISAVQVVTSEISIAGSTTALADDASATLDLTGTSYYAVSNVTTNVPAWVTIYTSEAARSSDTRSEGDPAPLNSGIVADISTTGGSLSHDILPFIVGNSSGNIFYIRAVNRSGSTVSVRVTLSYIPL
ncbi:hypothetical protein [Vulcanococcus sp.]|uniref:hypothetical protein n=1 Tax=Vulcanococcus sp. TaxID=2856995 RepID=UPI003F698C6A